MKFGLFWLFVIVKVNYLMFWDIGNYFEKVLVI